jgi:ubiquinone/menaquinone biosynthesis C-methylase UbiE
VAELTRNEVALGFSSTARDYDEVVRHNIEGARRLIASLPDGAYDDVLDVGCGTGFASLAMIARFGTHRITGVDPAPGMLESFAQKLGEVPDTRISLHEADVLEMPVPEGAFDAVICSMAFHWFPRKAEAMAAMAAPLRPGGYVAVLCSGRGGEDEFRRILSDIVPPMPQWVAAFDIVQRDIPEMEAYIEAAGLEPVDIWMERRIRRTPVEDYLERMRVVASHLHADMPPDDLAEMRAKVEAATREVSGPRGFEYTFTKLFAIARKPEV